MTSEDKITAGFENLRVYIDGRFVELKNDFNNQLKELHAGIIALDKKVDLLSVEVRGINTRIEDIKFFVSLSFGVLAVVVALVAFVPFVAKIAKFFRQSFITREQMQGMLNEAIERKNIQKI